MAHLAQVRACVGGGNTVSCDGLRPWFGSSANNDPGLAMFKKKTTSKDMLASGKHMSGQKNWYADRYQAMLVQRNILAFVTVVALVATLISSLSVSLLTPLKAVQPFVIQVDEKTGLTETVKPLSDKEISTNDALARYFIVQYVRARESYDPALTVDHYGIVRLMTDSSIFEAYKKQVSSNNPDSPVNRFGTLNRRVISVRSVTITGKGTAQLRIRATIEGELATLYPKPIDYVVWVGYEFASMQLTDDQKQINPVGFRVVSYSVDQEIVKE